MQKTLKQRRRKVAGGLPDLAEVIRGSVVRRWLHCGKSECHCHQGRGHGPYYYLMTTLRPGKTRMLLIRVNQLKRVQRWVANFKALKKGLEKIVEINTQLLVLDRKTTEPAKRPARKRR